MEEWIPGGREAYGALYEEAEDSSCMAMECFTPPGEGEFVTLEQNCGWAQVHDDSDSCSSVCFDSAAETDACDENLDKELAASAAWTKMCVTVANKVFSASPFTNHLDPNFDVTTLVPHYSAFLQAFLGSEEDSDDSDAGQRSTTLVRMADAMYESGVRWWVLLGYQQQPEEADTSDIACVLQGLRHTLDKL